MRKRARCTNDSWVIVTFNAFVRRISIDIVEKKKKKMMKKRTKLGSDGR